MKTCVRNKPLYSCMAEAATRRGFKKLNQPRVWQRTSFFVLKQYTMKRNHFRKRISWRDKNHWEQTVRNELKAPLGWIERVMDCRWLDESKIPWQESLICMEKLKIIIFSYIKWNTSCLFCQGLPKGLNPFPSHPSTHHPKDPRTGLLDLRDLG